MIPFRPRFFTALHLLMITPLLWTKEGQSTTMSCSHTKDASYYQMYWYQQHRNGGIMELVAYSVGKDISTIEAPFNKSKYSMMRPSTLTTTLKIQHAEAGDSAVYYCASSKCDTGNEAYFGKGTKLTVLEDGRKPTPPTVKIFPPSPNECRYKDKPDWKIRKTLVCVASGFYPDHVSVSWKLNDEEVTDEVATDPAAKWDKNKKYYNITSRLRVLAKYWFKPEIKFSCIVHFYNGEKNTTHSASISEKYLKITQNAKVSYSVLIVKSCVYGALVCFLVWKLQVS
uniref:Ig-like domain-containing protein n=1 Tax=Cyprinodon variegatus TaxID=28743 RepID=A0A3Q2D633_CYPVA